MSQRRQTNYPAEFRQRAVRMAVEAMPNHRSETAAMTSVASQLGISSVETLRKWVRRAQIDSGERPGVTSEEHAEIKRLKRENAELRRANEILKSASAYFAAAELDRQLRP
jgi:transposase